MQQIDGVIRFDIPVNSSDQRGSFIKIYSSLVTPQLEVHELFISKTKKGYIRGMHLQIEPQSNNRIIHCLSGKIFDVLIDLRKESQTFLEITTVTLSSKEPTGLLVPAGVAHGFQSLVDDSEVLYLSDKTYHKQLDKGLNPLSLNVNWPLSVAGVSERDSQLPSIQDFQKAGHVFA